MATLTTEQIIDALSGVIEPELGKDIVTLELVEVLSLEASDGEWKTPAADQIFEPRHACPSAHARSGGVCH